MAATRRPCRGSCVCAVLIPRLTPWLSAYAPSGAYVFAPFSFWLAGYSMPPITSGVTEHQVSDLDYPVPTRYRLRAGTPLRLCTGGRPVRLPCSVSPMGAHRMPTADAIIWATIRAF